MTSVKAAAGKREGMDEKWEERKEEETYEVPSNQALVANSSNPY